MIQTELCSFCGCTGSPHGTECDVLFTNHCRNILWLVIGSLLEFQGHFRDVTRSNLNVGPML